MFTTKECACYGTGTGVLTSAFFGFGFGLWLVPAGIAIGALAGLLFYIAH